MIELIFSICMVGMSTFCEEKHKTFEVEHISQSECFRNGQIEMAKWLSENPKYNDFNKWRISKWQCAPLKAQKQDI